MSSASALRASRRARPRPERAGTGSGRSVQARARRGRQRGTGRQTRAGGDADGPGELNPERGARRSGVRAVAGRNGANGGTVGVLACRVPTNIELHRISTIMLTPPRTSSIKFHGTRDVELSSERAVPCENIVKT